MRKTNVLRSIAEVAVPSTHFLTEPDFHFTGSDALIPYQFERDGRVVSQSIHFKRVRAFRHHAESLCTPWHVKAYDQVVLIEDSHWVTELKEAAPKGSTHEFVLNHYMVYLDSSGVFEVVAESFTLDQELVG